MPAHPRRRHRLRTAIAYAAARGAATAAGADLAALIAWWLTHHAHLIRL